MYKSGLIRKDRVIFKIYYVTTWLTNNCNTRIARFSKIKDNQTMKFGHLIEYNMRKIFVEKSYPKCCEETIPGPFSEKSKLSLSLDQQS